MIEPVSQIENTLKVVLYGGAGTGKTTTAASFPGPILDIDVTEKGTASVSDVKGLSVLRPQEWQDVVDAFWYVKSEKKFKTVMIDTVSNLQDLAIRQILEDAGKDDEESGWGIMTRRQWGQASTMMKALLGDFRDLSMNVVFIAHDRVSNAGEEAEEGMEDGQIMPQVGPRLMPSVASWLNAAVGIIGNSFVRERSREVKIGKKKVVKRQVEYCLRVGPHAYYTTKLRKPKSIVVPAFVTDPTYDRIIAVMRGEE